MAARTTLPLRSCPAQDAAALLAGLGLAPVPVDAEGWFPADAPCEDPALLSLLLARVAAFGHPDDPLRAFRARHEALVRDVMDRAVRRLGVVPSLEGAQLRFGARGLPEAIALRLDDWVAGGDRETLAALAGERIDAHLATRG
jgi:hypothetical protein